MSSAKLDWPSPCCYCMNALFSRAAWRRKTDRKKMLDIKWIRENPDAFDAAMIKRGAEVRAAQVLALDKAARGSKTGLQELQQESNALAKQIGELMGKGKKDEAAPLLARSKEVKALIAAAKDQAEQGGDSGGNGELEALLLTT